MTERLRYEIVDVFTDRPFAGNPLAVVLDADDLTATQMQALANEFNLSETSFALAPTAPGATYRVRIFTAETELPFAGHPSVGAAHTLARLGRIPTGDVTQECGAGLLPVRIGGHEVTLTGGTPEVGASVDRQALLAAVGLDPDDAGPQDAGPDDAGPQDAGPQDAGPDDAGPDDAGQDDAGQDDAGQDDAGPQDASPDDTSPAPPLVAGCGISFAYLRVKPPALNRTVPDPHLLHPLGVQTGVSVFAWDPAARGAHARVFAGEVGVAEDPATGSAALGLGVWLVASGLLDADGTTSYTVRQGIEMGRPSTLRCTVTAKAGKAVAATVSGGVVPIASGEIAVPPDGR